MFQKTKLMLAAVVAFGALVASPVQALVAKSTTPSLLGTKKVLIIHGIEASGAHANARIALNTKFRQIQRDRYPDLQIDSVRGNAPPTSFTVLDQYDIIIFNYWFDTQLSPVAFRNAFQTWANSTNKKRGWIGMHTSGANTSGEWDWLRDSVTSMRYRIHSTTPQPGIIRKSTDAAVLAHPIMEAMADTFRVPEDEWYDWETTAPTYGDIRVMYNLDETTLAIAPTHPMNPHPMAWYRENPTTKNRYFYTPLVHTSSGVTSTAGNDFFASMMMRALEYVAGYDTASSALLNGNNLGKHNPVPYLFVKGELKVEAAGAYKVEVLSLSGKTLYQASGKNRGTHRSAVLRKPGMYLVKVSSRQGIQAQRIMVQ